MRGVYEMTLLVWLACLRQTWARSAPGCAIMDLAGQAPGEAQYACMGEYELQDVLHDGHPVYRSGEGAVAHYMFHAGGGSSVGARWVVAARIGAAGQEVLLETARGTAAQTPDHIVGSWSARDHTAAAAGGGGGGGGTGTAKMMRVHLTTRCKAKCKIVSIRGEREGDPQENAMGDYVIQPRMNDGRPVYKFMDSTYGSRFLFFSSKYKSWNVGQKVGGDHFELFVSNTAFTPDQITGTWKVSAKGSFTPNDAVGAQCASSCTKVQLRGLAEGMENSDCMGIYVQLDAMNDNKPVYKLTNGAKYLYYSPFYENWNVGSKIGADKFDMFVTSKAQTADAIAGLWKVQVAGKFAPHPEVTTTCAEDPCGAFSMVTTCSSHFSSDGCGWCHPRQQCAAKKFCKVGWSRRAQLTKVITDKQTNTALFAGSDALDGGIGSGGEAGGVAGATVSKKTVLICSGVAGLLVLMSWCMLLRNDTPRGGLGAMRVAASSAYGVDGGGGGGGAYQTAGTGTGAGAQRGSGYQVSSLLA